MTRRNIKNCAPASDLARGEGLDGQCVNIGLHEGTDSPINKAVPGDPGKPREGLRNDGYAKVPAAIPCPGVSSMQVTFILDFEEFWLQRVEQLFPDAFYPLFIHQESSVRQGRSG